MFKQLEQPITRAEYDEAREKAIKKLLCIAIRTGEIYGAEYLDELIREQLLQNRFSTLTVSEYEKRHIPQNAPCDNVSIAEFALIVKGESA